LWVTTRDTKLDPWSTPVNLGPVVNTSSYELEPSISTDGLSLYFCSNRSDGFGGMDIWVTTRKTTNSDWNTPVNLGSTVNRPYDDAEPSISFDGQTLFFDSDRPGGLGDFDLYMTTRATIDSDWTQPVNVGPEVNSTDLDKSPSISSDGLALCFHSGRLGPHDLWMTTRPTIFDPWKPAVQLGPSVDSPAHDVTPDISFDGRVLFYQSQRSEGFGNYDLWQAPIMPIIDLNRDGIVDAEDLCILVDNWGTDNKLCDVGPMP